MHVDLMSDECFRGSHQGGMDVSVGSYVAFESNSGVPTTNSQSTAYFEGNLGDGLYTDEGCASYDWSRTADSFLSNHTSLGRDSSEQNNYALNLHNGFL